MKVGWKIAICVAAMWALNPDLEQHCPVAMKHIRARLPSIIQAQLRNNPWIPKWVVDNSGRFVDDRAEDFTQQLASQIERDSYLIFSVTKLRNPELVLLYVGRPKKFKVNQITSIGFLGMVF